jgi:hypothetical protein
MTDTNATIARWFAELRRRKVVRVAIVYIVIAMLGFDPRFDRVVARLCDMSSGRTS